MVLVFLVLHFLAAPPLAAAADADPLVRLGAPASDTPFVLNRTGAFSRQNYWQVLASRQVFPGLTLSTDYSEIEGDGAHLLGVNRQAAQERRRGGLRLHRPRVFDRTPRRQQACQQPADQAGRGGRRLG